jgi:hypothetical protein
MKSQISVESHSLGLVVEAMVEEHHIDLGVGPRAKESRFCLEQTLLEVVGVGQIEEQW